MTPDPSGDLPEGYFITPERSGASLEHSGMAVIGLSTFPEATGANDYSSGITVDLPVRTSAFSGNNGGR